MSGVLIGSALKNSTQATPNAMLNVRIAHVSCIIVGLVIRPKYPEVNS